MKKDWALALRNQCKKGKVPFFFKQWGGVRKATTGRRLEGKTYDEFPARIRHPVLTLEECSTSARKIELKFDSKIPPLSSHLVRLNPVTV